MNLNTLDNWRLVAVLLMVVVALLWIFSYGDQSALDRAHAHFGDIDRQVETLEFDMGQFNDTNWREVVPVVRDDVRELRKLIDEYKDKLDRIEMEREIERHNDRPDAP